MTPLNMYLCIIQSLLYQLEKEESISIQKDKCLGWLLCVMGVSVHIIILFNFRIKIGSEHAYIRHYRRCKRKPCMTEGQDLVNDTWMAEWSRKIQESVHSVRYRVFGNSSHIS